jgi:hypothetical protein
MTDLLLRLFPDAETLKSVGNDVLIAGLIGDILVLFFPSRRTVLEKALAAFFIIVIITGIWMERVADSKISPLFPSTWWRPILALKTA